MPDSSASQPTFDRLCQACLIRWQGNAHQLNCPQCACFSFLTMNAGDIGTAMHLEAANLTLKDFKIVNHDEHKASQQPGAAP